jgi:hypothetical protein
MSLRRVPGEAAPENCKNRPLVSWVVDYTLYLMANVNLCHLTGRTNFPEFLIWGN